MLHNIDMIWHSLQASIMKRRIRCTYSSLEEFVDNVSVCEGKPSII